MNVLNVLRSIIPEFKQIYKNLCVVLEIDEEPEWVEEILNLVL
jgi:hypothetical protein